MKASPTAGPLTCATIGFGNVRSTSKKRSAAAVIASGERMRSSRSIPAEKTVSWPFRSTTRTFGSVAASRSASVIVRNMSEVIVLRRSARSIVM